MAYGFADNSPYWIPSHVFVAGLTPDIYPPTATASPSGGMYSTAQPVALVASEPAAIYYTLDGTDPAATSQRYSEPIMVTPPATLKFMAVDLSGNQSRIFSASYELAPPLTVTAAPVGGTYPTAQWVTLTPSRPATIYYSVEGLMPDPAYSPTYTGPISYARSTWTLKYKAIDQYGNESEIYSQTYTVAEADPVPVGTVERISLSSEGVEGNGSSGGHSAISSDGRFVVFESAASILVPNDTNGLRDVFIRDRIAGVTERVSVSSTGGEGDGSSFKPNISADGRYVVFYSWADNLVDGDSNGLIDVFLHDRQTRTTERVSVSSTGEEANGNSWSWYHPFISADGRYVVFTSSANNLVSGDTNDTTDVFVHDRQTRTTSRVSISSAGDQGNGPSHDASISSDGRFVAFSSNADNLVSADANDTTDVFVHDRETGATTIVSASTSLEPGNGGSFEGFISASGRYVTFVSRATNLLPGDTNQWRDQGGVGDDIFVYDRLTGSMERVSVSTDGIQGNSYSEYPSISADGRRVVFRTQANSLVPGDTNNAADALVHDRTTRKTIRVSVSTNGVQTNGSIYEPRISADGGFVVFGSSATNLIPGDTNGVSDIFVFDLTKIPAPLTVTASPASGTYNSGVWVTLTASEPARIFYTTSGEEPNQYSQEYTGPISHSQANWTLRFKAYAADGRESPAYTETYSITPAAPVPSGTTERVSVAGDGTEGNDGTGAYPSISADGRFVSFDSYASNLVPGDTNGDPYSWMGRDVFVRDRQAGLTERVSLSGAGEQANGASFRSRLSGDGRFVAFVSEASNLVPGDTNGDPDSWMGTDVFVYDRQSRTTERVSVSSAGGQANGPTWDRPSISADGRFVAFSSEAGNLVPGDTNGEGDSWNGTDVFVRDRLTGITERVSVSSADDQANAWARDPAISADGRYVAFRSAADNLVPGDTNERTDVFVHDRVTRTTTRVSLSSAGEQADRGSYDVPAISADGRFIAFTSYATNLVPGDTNDEDDIFVHDRFTGTTERVSLSSEGVQGNDWPEDPAISGDGRYVVFRSWANTLVPGDLNDRPDIFLHDRVTNKTTMVSLSGTGEYANDRSYDPAISGDGRHIAFESKADNLVPNDNNDTVDVFVHTPKAAALTVPIDIKPGGEPNSLNLNSKGVVPVAVLSTAEFDAATVDPASVRFAGAAPVKSALEDVNGDKLKDLVLHLRTQDIVLEKNATTATLTGRAVKGQEISGTDSVRVVEGGRASRPKPGAGEDIKSIKEKENQTRKQDRPVWEGRMNSRLR